MFQRTRTATISRMFYFTPYDCRMPDQRWSLSVIQMTFTVRQALCLTGPGEST